VSRVSLFTGYDVRQANTTAVATDFFHDIFVPSFELPDGSVL